ncbi:MAG: sugar phosphate isomerase/epimerase [Treponema sp.]|jgi:sugar phosphate isomerase/epimerase|nr:sugar phosphate isomerase/epimerase [Treponema sp.]
MLAMTTDFHGTSRVGADVKGTLAKIAKAGYSHIHWCHEWTGAYLYSAHEMLQIREWCDELGLKVKGLHASSGEKKSDLKDYASLNDFNRLAGVELIKNRVDLAYTLDAEAIVLHLIVHVNDGEELREEHLRPVLKTLDELEPYCKTRHIKLCIENGGGPVWERALDTFFERYDKDYLGLCFDTGHAYLDGKENCLQYAQRYNDRIFMIHTHDNHGERDEHILPFRGDFDWEGFARFLARSPFTLPIVIEAYPGPGEEGDDMAWLKMGIEAGNRLTAMVTQYR